MHQITWMGLKKRLPFFFIYFKKSQIFQTFKIFKKKNLNFNKISKKMDNSQKSKLLKLILKQDLYCWKFTYIIQTNMSWTIRQYVSNDLNGFKDMKWKVDIFLHIFQKVSNFSNVWNFQKKNLNFNNFKKWIILKNW